MSDPNWGKVTVNTDVQPGTPVGDPTRWGAAVLQRVPFTSVGPHTLGSQQVLSASCRDGYARNWSLLGNLGAPALFWTFAEAPGPLTWSAMLEITMGVGQATLVHNINLRAVVTADAPFYFDSPPSSWTGSFGVPAQTLRVRPFIIPGGLLANKISVRIVHIVEYALPPLPDGDALLTTLQLAPFAAGTDL